ncbi:Fc.00g009000.m01.CDS01 [Cosmosporella sp. VM-42]
MSPSQCVDAWRKRVPSRLDREDPFADDGFEERPHTRLTLREPETPTRRPSTRLSFLRAATPLFGRRPSTSLSGRPPSVRGPSEVKGKKKSLLGLLIRKRKRRSPSPSPEPVPREPVRLNFLFVGSRASGQTSLLFRARYGYFPDAGAFARPLYETYDTSGVPDLNTVEKLTYISWDAIFLCFDVTDKISMYTIVQWWQHAHNNGFATEQGFEPLLHLVGMKKDLRDQCFLEDHREGSACSPSGLMAYPTCCVCPSEASWHAKRIGAHRYLECSAASGEGMDVVFDEAGREATRRAIRRGEDWEIAPGKKRKF